MTFVLPPTAVIRVSRARFDPARLAEVERMTRDTATYLIPAISGLSGLAGYFAGVSPSGSMAHVSLWESEAEARQMASLREMVETARREAEAVGVSLEPIVNHPLAWQV